MKRLLTFALAFALASPFLAAQVETKEKKSETGQDKKEAAKGYAVGAVVADFKLKDLDGKETSLKSIGEGKKFIVLDFWSRECPAAKNCEPGFAKLHKDYAAKGVAFVHIASNKKENKAESDLTTTKEYAKKNSITWPVLLDLDNKIADIFGGETTPHVFIIDVATMKVVYNGSFNDSPFKPDGVKKEYVKDAIEELVAGKAVTTATTKAMGCTIKRV